MVLQTHSHSSRGYPFCINGICSNGIANIQQRQQPQQQQVQMQQQLPQQQHFVPNPNHVVHASETVTHADLLVHTSNLATQFEKEWEEIAYLFRLQNEQMKMTLENQRKQQVATFRNMENLALQILAQKEQELAQAARKKQELEGLLTITEAEKRKWKRMALDRETTVIFLRAKLEEEKRVRILMENDAESCCGENEGENEEGRDEKRLKRKNNKLFCLECNKKSSDGLFLPCKDCEDLLHAYPNRGMDQKSTSEINNLA